MRHAGFRGTGRDREGWCGQLCVEHDVRTTSECKQEERATGPPRAKGETRCCTEYRRNRVEEP